MNKKSNNKFCFCVQIILVLPVVFLLAFTVACDGNHKEDPVSVWIDCQLLSRCTYANTRFGMVGDSWTDLLLGTQTQRDLYDWLITEHGYRITAINIAGQTMNTEANSAFSYRRVIENAGVEIRYMLISLGGNDMLARISEYTSSNLSSVLDQRLDLYESQFLNMIVQGDARKIELYSGKPLQWFVHGYDYANPEMVSPCKATNVPQNEREAAMRLLVDRFNERLLLMSQKIPNLHYIDLRGTLGGPPVSDPALKLDCIHPNEMGFRLLAERYAKTLQLYTQER